jgi:hypothetical protein
MRLSCGGIICGKWLGKSLVSWQLAVGSWQLAVGSWQLSVVITNYQLYYVRSIANNISRLG